MSQEMLEMIYFSFVTSSALWTFRVPPTFPSYLKKLITVFQTTGVARNFDWRRRQNRKNLYVILVTFFGEVMAITSLKGRHN